MNEKNKKINWEKFTSEEINLKKIGLNNTYQMLMNMCSELITEMEKIEVEWGNANEELEKRGF